ncbi:RNA polymerase sigma-70 factor, ECF subfamily [Amycolatopsis xylanica]|uniref:RNA polymerase sigma-70 factor, ECF subfamily n=1 Tax=Amycolatopsis xylanica TaxID=589385 RepID=A0A1H3M7W5_9PSEU|nr:RNA polymerase sigma factor [Amycolatopsis xylanica]SDY72703.1 RNA polymerase sigma-70 factor, ECF subfamily [Amycolatopsis xylanica]
MGVDQEGFTKLYEALYPRVLAYSLRRVPPDDAHDATDETFLIAWRKRKQLPDPALPWLLVTARNTIANQRRRRDHQDVIAAELARCGEHAALDPGAAVVERTTLLTALATLTDKEREALMLTEWDGLSGRDAARVAGCSAVAFAVRLHRARNRFADAVTKLDSRLHDGRDLAASTHSSAKDGSQ